MEDILKKAMAYCAVQERCVRDVEDKLRQWNVNPDKAAKIIEQLIRENYLDEERFARSFAGGKFRINHWGKTKITFELERRGVPDRFIRAGLEEIGDDEYEKTLRDILVRKNREIREPDPFKRKQKLIAFAQQRGYHYSLVKVVLDDINL